MANVQPIGGSSSPFGSRKATDYATGKKPEASGIRGLLGNKWLWIALGAAVIFGVVKLKRKR